MLSELRLKKKERARGFLEREWLKIEVLSFQFNGTEEPSSVAWTRGRRQASTTAINVSCLSSLPCKLILSASAAPVPQGLGWTPGAEMLGQQFSHCSLCVRVRHSCSWTRARGDSQVRPEERLLGEVHFSPGISSIRQQWVLVKL